MIWPPLLAWLQPDRGIQHPQAASALLLLLVVALPLKLHLLCLHLLPWLLLGN
jgi:hypothetical protein